MSIHNAAQKGVNRYKLALARGTDTTTAYIKGLDYIIDDVFKGHDMLSEHVLQAISVYQRRIGV